MRLVETLSNFPEAGAMFQSKVRMSVRSTSST